jgi:hypothetical protein
VASIFKLLRMVPCRRQTQRYNLSNRCIPLVRKGLDVIILPGEQQQLLQQRQW